MCSPLFQIVSTLKRWIFGNLDYPETIIYDVSFQRFSDWMGIEDWESIEEALLSGLTSLKAAGADFAIIATNTMHILS
ncbi:unnamed protein product, partial [marine sediment metagenome]